MAYVYKHIRNDNNQPFYIGVGGLNSFDNYQRANAKNKKGLRSRSNFWYNIVNLYGFTVEIVMDNCNSEDAFKKEIELISLYGRKDLGTGLLVNHTSGGEGNHDLSEESRKRMSNKGRKHSEETKNKISIGNKGKVLSNDDKLKKSIAAKGKPKNYRNNTAKNVIDTSTGAIFESCVKAAKSINLKSGTLRAMLLGRNKNKTTFLYE